MAGPPCLTIAPAMMRSVLPNGSLLLELHILVHIGDSSRHHYEALYVQVRLSRLAKQHVPRHEKNVRSLLLVFSHHLCAKLPDHLIRTFLYFRAYALSDVRLTARSASGVEKGAGNMCAVAASSNNLFTVVSTIQIMYIETNRPHGVMTFFSAWSAWC